MGGTNLASTSRQMKMTNPTVSPAPLRVGIDLIALRDVAASLGRFGVQYEERVFTAREIAYCRSSPGTVAVGRFAARFAAKEAAIKVLCPDQPGLDWRSIEVTREQDGSASLVLHDDASALAVRRGLSRFAVSLSHDDEYATAVVVAQP